MKETIFIQEREGDSNLKHVIEFTYLSYVTVVLTKLSQMENRENSKGVWGSNAFPFSIRLFLLNGIGVLQMRERLCGIK